MYDRSVWIVTVGERGEGSTIKYVCATRKRCEDYAYGYRVSHGANWHKRIYTDNETQYVTGNGVDIITIQEYEVHE